MTVSAIKSRVSEIRGLSNDSYVLASHYELVLWRDVLECIAKGTEALPWQLAETALTTLDCVFPRVTAHLAAGKAVGSIRGYSMEN